MLSYDPGYGPLVQSSIRIATWNIWARYGPWAARGPAILTTLRALDADIVGLQEVWDSDVANQAQLLAKDLGYTTPVYASNLTFADGTRAGNAVMSRWPISRAEVRTLPRTAGDARDDEGEERLCVFAEVDAPRGPIQVFCAHLSWRDDHSAVRQQQVKAICEFVKEQRPRPTFPAVLLGDLNSEPTSDEIRMLTGRAAVPVPGVVFRDAWDLARNRDAGFTASNDNPFVGSLLGNDTRIDYVMVGQPKLGGVGHVLRARVFGDEMVDGMLGSDHYGVVAELRY
ncbi:MAG: endonuclease/exonuclease/phosphatase family protein [Actinomycetota bacterium]